MKITYIFAKNSTKIAASRNALFDTDMHQILSRLGLRPRPLWGYLQRSPDPLDVFRGPTSKGGEGRGGEREGKGREGKGREGRGREERAGDGRGGPP